MTMHPAMMHPAMPPEPAQLRAMIGVQAMAIEALTRRITALEVELTDLRRAEPAGAVPVLAEAAQPVLRRLTMAEIATAVGVRTGVAIADLRGHHRTRLFVYARMIFCGMARRSGYSLQQIGTWLGGRDHSTILESARGEEKALRYFAEMRAAADEVNA